MRESVGIVSIFVKNNEIWDIVCRILVAGDRTLDPFGYILGKVCLVVSFINDNAKFGSKHTQF